VKYRLNVLYFYWAWRRKATFVSAGDNREKRDRRGRVGKHSQEHEVTKGKEIHITNTRERGWEITQCYRQVERGSQLSTHKTMYRTFPSKRSKTWKGDKRTQGHQIIWWTRQEKRTQTIMVVTPPSHSLLHSRWTPSTKISHLEGKSRKEAASQPFKVKDPHTARKRENRIIFSLGWRDLLHYLPLFLLSHHT